MASSIELTTSGAGIASARVPTMAAQLLGILANPGSAALSVSIYACPTEPSGSIPAGSTLIASLDGASGGPSVEAALPPDGIGVQGWLAAQFTDDGSGHSVFLYVK